jgi:hypothetical protein
MTFSIQQSGLFASLRRLRASSWILTAALAGAMAIPGTAEAVSARRVGGYDGVWNVLIITQAGHCDTAYSYPFQVASGRISSAGAATVSGSVGSGGGVVVRISAAGAVANGSGRLSGSWGAGRWNASLSGGNCSGRWQATRS